MMVGRAEKFGDTPQEIPMLALSLIGSSFAGDSFVQLSVETATEVPSLAVDARAKVLVDAPLGESKKVSVGIFAIAKTTYGKVYAGPTLHVQKLALNLSVGLETNEMPLRVAGSVFVANDRLSFLAIGEYGGSGVWYKGLAKANFGHLNVGVLTQRFDGVGPRVGVATRGLEFWASPMYDYEDGSTNVLGGVNWTL